MYDLHKANKLLCIQRLCLNAWNLWRHKESIVMTMLRGVCVTIVANTEINHVRLSYSHHMVKTEPDSHCGGGTHLSLAVFGAPQQWHFDVLRASWSCVSKPTSPPLLTVLFYDTAQCQPLFNPHEGKLIICHLCRCWRSPPAAYPRRNYFHYKVCGLWNRIAAGWSL